MADDSKYRIHFDELEKFMKDVLMAKGVEEADAARCAKVLIQADKQGMDTHGIQRLKTIYCDRIDCGQLNTKTVFDVVKETETTAVVDGHNGMGHSIAMQAMQLAIDKAKKHGMGMVVVRNGTHYGIAGYYPQMAAQQGCIGFSGCNARPSVCPCWSVEPKLGTNPLVFAFPSDEGFPFCLDCATSIVQRGKIEMYAREGKKCQPGWVCDRSGKVLSEPGPMLEAFQKGTAACYPLGGYGEEMGGHKGYGYACDVEILSSALSGANFLSQCGGLKDGKKVPIELGQFFMAINIESFRPLADFEKQVGDIARELRAAAKAPGATRIYTPGEKEHETFLERSQKGVFIPEVTRSEMEKLRADCKLDTKFPWDN
ncbi:malate dehydrogenase, putative [Entamoeba histolytica HM-1:IMSS-B]|uniref:Malate dehydrogenase, putative n=6 Tax=Entamoeba histolytica TaxID=5759 RepID=C4LV07_ENTH1|nr:malate dehydrogenase, putative [Entamoeba histolytica HM-1:IMSS]EMD44483.1 malate dehydrogenase, putative [Entamoeba histolytica KU27]EMH73092.1 malate dehydrogenase, putative [Entamoeba histolytica HM-1:IMSS-B]EMS17083.1 malate dehydrogenase [Entamoeba histolytica HM-3:IMSS]ENY63159.1 malate dehydrogenase, putative [Entamoeba histolytica HM-1:IMSS-A]BAN37659.1 malate dehydrogenase, putative [Entamoeba histolytica]|eukprot:XP_655601.1 malate dehydrogenase, putative [Entamoeba histolytica HM-1:IMSS]